MVESRPHPTLFARQLRREMTPAERHLWRSLSARKVVGARFNRQVAIGPFFGDFVCRAVKLVVEVDGGQHGWRTDEDAARTRFLEAHGYRVIRFWNNDVLENVEGVIETIAHALRELPSPSPSRKREGSGAAPAPISSVTHPPTVELDSPSIPLPSRLREGPGEGLPNELASAKQSPNPLPQAGGGS